MVSTISHPYGSMSGPFLKLMLKFIAFLASSFKTPF